jgi:hypothetical protein
MQEEEKDSFHGKLIKTVLEHWASQSLFEQNDAKLRKGLDVILKKYLPKIQVKLNWNMNPQFIDACALVGDIIFIDENNKKRVLNLYITATEVNTQ